MGISSLGIGSGIDVRSLVDQLLAAERAPVQNRLDRQEGKFQAELSAFGSLKNALAAFKSTVAGLTNINTFQKISTKVSDKDALSVSAGHDAALGSFDVSVSNLAQSQSVASGSFSDANTVVGSGTLTFRFGTVTTDGGDGISGNVTAFSQNADVGTQTVTIDASNNTLSGIRDAVNEADIGVRAAIVNDGSGYRLTFVSEETGADNGFVVETSDDDGNDTDASGLSQLAFNTSATQLTRSRVGEDAVLTINGLEITRSSNEVEDAIEGVTLTLLQETEDNVSVELSQNRGAVADAVSNFVKSYNDLQAQINQIANYNQDTKQASVLLGDATVRTVRSSLRNVMSSLVEGLSGDITSLADIGITTKQDGTLSLESGKLNKVLADDFELVGALFAPLGRPTDDTVEYLGYGTLTKPGSYGITITQAASRGVRNGDSVLPDFAGGGSVTIDDSSDNFKISIDGTISRELSITQGSYSSGDALAAEIQSRINGDQNLQAAGKSVIVSYDSADNRLVFTSESYGSESTVEITSAEAGAVTALGVSTGTGTAGNDVAGSIGGATAEGEGQTLTATDGDAKGLELTVTGDATGSRGSVTFTLGLMGQLEQQLERLLEDDGALDAKIDGLTANVEDITESRKELEARLEKVETRYIKQFSAMDALVSQLTQTQDFLSRQLAALENLSKRAGGRSGG